jgi:hypothetical protein
MVDPNFERKEGMVDLTQFDVPLYRRPATGEITPDMIGKDPAQETKPKDDDK